MAQPPPPHQPPEQQKPKKAPPYLPPLKPKEVQAQQPTHPVSVISVTGPLVSDHAKFRMLLGELRGAVVQFDLPVIRRLVMDLHSRLGKHMLQEETGLYLVGMKVLRADNAKIPKLIEEHHKTTDSLASFIRALYSPRLVNVEDQIRSLGFVFIDDILHHLEDEEQVVFPAFERLLPEDLKKLILKRYQQVAGDEADALERTPLISLPPLEPESPLPAAGAAAEVFPKQKFSAGT